MIPSTKSILKIALAVVCIVQVGCTISMPTEYVPGMMAEFDKNSVAAYMRVSFFPKTQHLRVGIIVPGNDVLERKESTVPNMFAILDDRIYFESENDKTAFLVNAVRSNVMYLYRSMVTSKMFDTVDMIEALPGTVDQADAEEMKSYDVIVKLRLEDALMGDSVLWRVQFYDASIVDDYGSVRAVRKFGFDVQTQWDPMTQLERIRGTIMELHRTSGKPRQ